MILNNKKIHIWKCLLNQPEQVRVEIFSILSEDERIKAEKIKLTEVKNRWVVARGVLRLLLSKYSDCPPDEIEFYFNDFGKPRLSKKSDVSFNLSHADNLAVYIFALNRRIGIDVEKMKELEDMEGLTGLCFSQHEKNWFNKISPAERKEMFYRIWTSKEAYIKAIGKGFSFSPLNITLEMHSDKNLYFKYIIDDDDFNNWNLIKFSTFPGFVSSAVIEGDKFIIEKFHLNFNTCKLKSLDSLNYSIEKIIL